MFEIFTTIGTLGLAASLIMLRRNRQVYDYRIKALYQDYNLYKTLPSYDDMMLKFWKKWPELS